MEKFKETRPRERTRTRSMNTAYFEASEHAVNLDQTSQEKSCKRKEKNKTFTWSQNNCTYSEYVGCENC